MLFSPAWRARKTTNTGSECPWSCEFSSWNSTICDFQTFSNSTMFGWLQAWHLHNGRGLLIFWQREKIKFRSHWSAFLKKNKQNYINPTKTIQNHHSSSAGTSHSQIMVLKINHLRHGNSWNPTPWGWYVTSAKKIATIWCTNVKCRTKHNSRTKHIHHIRTLIYCCEIHVFFFGRSISTAQLITM